ncbi:MAG: NirD/YgiW/YdeI family stress tolerance protein [Treponema sp.]|jgi:uncharacterized protein (TIGR00156 family)|nr:NirD/YgiW/YdeI family stress tolerance protein [Treponema sp.]
MKRNNGVVLAVMALLIGVSLHAQEGYHGPGLAPITVQEAKTMKDVSPVALRGRIVAFLWIEQTMPNYSYYVFSDETGSIRLMIDKSLWKGLSVTENDTVEITGMMTRGNRDDTKMFFVQRIQKV